YMMKKSESVTKQHKEIEKNDGFFKNLFISMRNHLAPFCRIPYTITVVYKICLYLKKEQG
ncbi:MAG: hypothetical protein IJE57_00670, partial [Anaerotignum sp.]|nr:hypothetical protein [Anaerotignum sp.]